MGPTTNRPSSKSPTVISSIDPSASPTINPNTFSPSLQPTTFPSLGPTSRPIMSGEQQVIDTTQNNIEESADAIIQNATDSPDPLIIIIIGCVVILCCLFGIGFCLMVRQANKKYNKTSHKEEKINPI